MVPVLKMPAAIGSQCMVPVLKMPAATSFKNLLEMLIFASIQDLQNRTLWSWAQQSVLKCPPADSETH
jgi:hypothetical protein